MALAIKKPNAHPLVLPLRDECSVYVGHLLEVEFEQNPLLAREKQTTMMGQPCMI
jgi:hypothetical protein